MTSVTQNTHSNIVSPGIIIHPNRTTCYLGTQTLQTEDMNENYTVLREQFISPLCRCPVDAFDELLPTLQPLCVSSFSDDLLLHDPLPIETSFTIICSVYCAYVSILRAFTGVLDSSSLVYVLRRAFLPKCIRH